MVLLKAGGARTKVELEEAQQILDRFLLVLKKNGGFCHTLDLSCRAWPVDSLQKLEPLFLQVKGALINLKIDDIIASLLTADGLASLEFLAVVFSDAPNLKWVNLSDNAIGTRGIACLSPLLTNASVTSFFLENCGLAEADGSTFRDLLVDPSNPRSLRELSLSRNQMGPGGAKYIGELLGNACAKGLQSFSYAGSRPRREGTMKLCAGLAKFSENCGVSGTQLINLDLNDCCLGSGEEDDDPVFHLCTLLRNSPRLQKLNLRDCELNVSGLELILKALQESAAALTTLDLGAIGELGEEGGDLINDFFLSSSPTKFSLQELLLDTNELGDEGAVKVVVGVAGACRNLRVLDISQNDLVEIGTLLRCNHIPTLHKLKLEDNPDIKAGAELRELLSTYEDVTVDDDLEYFDEENDIENNVTDDGIDNGVDALVNEFADTHL